MNCSAVQHNLSAYHDNELSPELRAAVEEHLHICHDCSARLAAFREISRVAADLNDPTAPTGMWEELQSKLQRQARQGELSRPRTSSSTLMRRRLATAALVLLAISAALGIWRYQSSEQRQMGVIFGHFLDQFPRDPIAAQRAIVTRYDGQAVTLDEATRKLRYRPALPTSGDALRLEKMYVLRMPCCICVETIYKNANGEMLAVFEHHDEDPGWFSNRPTIRAHCSGKPTSIVQVDNHLAATWKHQDRYLTVVGARNVEQVASLIAGFQRPETQ
ncbi:MAG: anti-sigma factor [Pirellulales bacterium]